MGLVPYCSFKVRVYGMSVDEVWVIENSMCVHVSTEGEIW